ncbi:ImmA/IrrE family metallo-endopeptidase [Rhizobium laguerreae]|uniref:ImmA/IrrE family metallo-endopeptidase n=1 Tax=Rhizobium laguerreae TaxID=1076926 RepID=UPI001C906286|nr:ImmA/IrrE family metallo-endopeptidase [Rhizobium laguerreae]MBY3258832.1 ImmA/IrrE family metallo-endopeptidase [Rhizobium laguerreae]MBY3282027.1 ImmA/IrrE family metallo-endopeptidase [Rhizobium laguerreae]MBY3293317.1 ImmA/IrrE family metallo-endopeptidase [Rhizobium laguerreae]
MNSTSKGDRLEDAFYHYLLDQQDRGELIFGAHPPENCRIYRKKAYYSREREADVEFDVVLELYRKGRDTPHLYVIFECKNHEASISEVYVNDFSSKIGRIFPHAVKGVMVVTSRLQAGAEKVARNARMGIVKYDEQGLEIIADRRGSCFEHGFVRSQIFRSANSAKSLKFSAYHDGEYFSSIDRFLGSLEPELVDGIRPGGGSLPVPYLSIEQIKSAAGKILKLADYESGAVDLVKVCQSLSIDLQFADRAILDADGVAILGSANFGRKAIEINSHSRETRERFTIAHEIGHFCLNHERYLRSETIIERDLFVTREKDGSFNYERLEYQANAFSAELLLPDAVFLKKTAHFRRDLGMRDRGHGYIFVDDQPGNSATYDELLSRLSTHFEVSKQAIEVKLKKSKMLTDQRKRNEASPISRVFAGLISPRKS